MPFHTGLARGAKKFFSKQGLRQFGRKVEGGLNKAINFTEKKILPTIENVAGKVAKGALVASAIAPEFAPVLGAIGAGAKVVQGGARAGRGLIGTGREVVGAIRRGDEEGVIRAGQKFRQEAETAVAQGKEGVMKINRPPQRNPLRGQPQGG